MPSPAILPRAAGPLFRQALDSVRVIIVTGPRQAGMSTFVKSESLATDGSYLTLDDDDTLLRARTDPRAFVASGPAIIDEVQRAFQTLTG